MRISALSSLLVLTAIAGSAHADRATEYRYHARTTAVAAAEPTHAYEPRGEQGSAGHASDRAASAATFTAGRIALTGPSQPQTRDLTDAVLGIERPAPREPGARRDPFLTHHDVTAGVAPHAAELERCYLDHTARGGKLDVTLVIGRDGDLVSLKAAAAGLPARTTHQIESCMRDIVQTVQFPERRNETTAVVPYLFHKATAAGAGPILSCWSARGC